MKWIDQKAATLRILFFFFLWALIILLILAAFKYVFLTSCITIGSIKECVTTAVDSSGTLFAIGGILVAIVALVPTFWIDSKIRDAKKEIGQEIFAEVKGEMQLLSKAQMLIFHADRYLSPATLLIRDALIQDAVNLWPAFKQEEFRKLSSALSEAIIAEFYQMSGSGIIQGTSIQKNMMGIYIDRAIFYLEDTVQSSEVSDRDLLVNLACMYGCAGRYDDMIRVIEKAIKVDENAKDDFQGAKRLSLLMYACGTDRRKIERLGKKIGKELPLSKDAFVQTIQKVDLHNRIDYIRFFALKKHRSAAEEYVYMVIVTAVDKLGQRSVTGLYMTIFESKDSKQIPPMGGETVSMEEFFNEVDKELYVICFADD